MSKAVETAARWVNTMVLQEAKAPGDTINAMRRLSSRYSVPYGLLWSLKYRPPKDLYVSVFEKLEAAYERETRRAVSVLNNERASYEARTGVSKALCSLANGLAGEEDR